MESDDTAAALRDAEQARDALAGDVRLPRGHDLALGAAVAALIATWGPGVALDDALARWALAGALVLFLVVALAELWLFSRVNGVRVGGYANKVVFGGTPVASWGLGMGFVASLVGAFEGWWWLVAVAALAGGAAYGWGARVWMRRYRQEPVKLAPGLTRLQWVLVALPVLWGVVILGVLSR